MNISASTPAAPETQPVDVRNRHRRTAGRTQPGAVTLDVVSRHPLAAAVGAAALAAFLTDLGITVTAATPARTQPQPYRQQTRSQPRAQQGAPKPGPQAGAAHRSQARAQHGAPKPQPATAHR